MQFISEKAGINETMKDHNQGKGQDVVEVEIINANKRGHSTTDEDDAKITKKMVSNVLRETRKMQTSTSKKSNASIKANVRSDAGKQLSNKGPEKADGYSKNVKNDKVAWKIWKRNSDTIPSQERLSLFTFALNLVMRQIRKLFLLYRCRRSWIK